MAIFNCDKELNKIVLNIQNSLSMNKFFLLYGFVWCLISFGFELFNFTWSIDDELFAYAPGPAVEWITQGRFTSACLLGIFFNNLCLPFFPLLFSQICLLGAYYIIWIRLETVSGWMHYLAFPLFAASPLLFYVYTFSCLTPIIGLGFLLSALAVYLFEKKCWYTVALSFIIGGFAVGCYQLFMQCIICLLIINLLKELDNKDIRYFLKNVFLSILFCSGVLITYLLMWKIALIFAEVPVSPYIVQMLPENNTFIALSLYDKILGIVIRMWKYFVMEIWTDLSCSVILIVTSIWVLLKNKWHKKAGWDFYRWCIYLFLLGALVLIPLTFFFINRNSIAGLRTVTPLIIMIPTVFIFAWQCSNLLKRIILGLLAVLTIAQFLYLNSKFSYSCYLRNKRDQIIATDIVNKLLPEIRLQTQDKVPIIFVGERELDINLQQFISGKQREAIGSSVFHWGGGDENRIVHYLNQFLIFDFEVPKVKDFDKVKDLIPSMPCYPAKGSVLYKNNVAIVKFSEQKSTSVDYFK